MSNLWRGDLSPMGCEAAPKPDYRFFQENRISWITTASQPIGDKSPRHREAPQDRSWAHCKSQVQINHRSHPG
ncbi:hypothetical protein C3E97_006635 [Pseudomonas sp. MWU12-2115]|nr:hypothetical protein C3E97_006635 [Pseudomonas sp. MWU12-2115]